MARLGVRSNQSNQVERFTLMEGETVTLADGWTLRLVKVWHQPEGAGKATVGIELKAVEDLGGQ